MKVLITVNTYYPSNDGVANVTRSHAEELVRRGHDVTVFTPHWEYPESSESYNGVKIRRFDISSKNGIYNGKIKSYVESVVVEANSSDALIAVCLQTVSVDTLLPHLDRIKCRKILYMHGMWDFKWHSFDYHPPIHILYKLWSNLRWHYLYGLKWRYIKEFDEVIQLSENDDAYRFFKSKGYENLSVIRNAVDDMFFERHENHREILRKYDIPEGRYAICVSNYIPGKNQKFLLEAFSQIKSKDVFLLCIGSSETEYYRELCRYADSLHCNVVLKTGIDRNDIPVLMQNAQMFLFSSLAEKQPMCIFESMASSILFISTDVGDVKGRPGGVVINNTDEMASFIDYFLDNDDKKKELAYDGFVFALNNLTKKKFTDKLENMICDL